MDYIPSYGCDFDFMSQNQVIMEIAEKYKPLWALDSASALPEWDMETYMPLGSSAPRGFALAQTQLMKQERMTKLVDLAQKAEKSSRA